MTKIFNYKYLTEAHLKGFDNYKYSALDTSPLSKYIMHPIWNAIVKIIPKWIAPNLITFVGFICMLISVVILLYYNSDRYGFNNKLENPRIPESVFLLCAILIILAYNLDGLDGKQARRLGVSGPLGEMFDHGLDSYVVFFIVFCLYLGFGREEYYVSVFRAYLIILSVLLNFYACHCEKYNTGTLYLPWGYEFGMWASSGILLLAGFYGAQVFDVYVFSGITYMQTMEVVVHSTGLLTTFPIAVYNVYLSYQNRTGKMYPLLEALRPIWSMLAMVSLMTFWAILSPNDILETDIIPFLFLFGTLFSNISSRLIVAEMSDTRCEVFCCMLWPIFLVVALSFYQPQWEITLLYIVTAGAILAHLHYGVCVVRQMCDHLKVKCFTVPKSKQK